MTLKIDPEICNKLQAAADALLSYDAIEIRQNQTGVLITYLKGNTSVATSLLPVMFPQGDSLHIKGIRGKLEHTITAS